MPIEDAIVSGMFNFGGGLLGMDQQEKNRDMQREFAQNGISWKVADANRAGIHPLYALGAPTMSPSVSSFSPMGEALSRTGQDVSRAMNATRSVEQRDDAYSKTVQDMSLTRMGLENDLLASKIQRLKVNSNPPLPTGDSGVQAENQVVGEGELKDKTELVTGGKNWDTSPEWSNAEEFENRYGDVGENLFGAMALVKDLIDQTSPFLPNGKGRRELYRKVSRYLPKWLDLNAMAEDEETRR